MSLQVYGYWRSSASYRVRIALNLKQLDYQYIPVHLVNNGGEQKAEAYRAINPTMLVPTLIDDDADILLNQSMAIIEYLDEVYPSEPRLLPKHSVEKARVRAFAADIACDIQPLVNLRVLQKVETQCPNTDKVSWAKDWIEHGFQAIEAKLASHSGKYCFGYELSLADICLVPQVYSALRFGVNLADYPNIAKVYENCQQLDAFMKAAPEQQADAPSST